MNKNKNKNKIVIGLLIVIAAVITAYGFVRGGSYNRALAKAGISDKLHWHETVYDGTDADGNRRKVLVGFNNKKTETMTIVLLTEKPLWGWALSKEIVAEPNEKSLMMTIEKPPVGFISASEKHIVYAGINAVKKIETLSDVLPPNVTADIYSSDGSPYYWLHFVSYGGDAIEPERMLRQKGYIE